MAQRDGLLDGGREEVPERVPGRLNMPPESVEHRVGSCDATASMIDEKIREQTRTLGHVRDLI